MAQDLNCLCSDIPIREDLKGIELITQNISSKLTECLGGISGSYCSLGLAEVREDIREDSPYTLPQYYISNREWVNLEPSTSIDILSFFYKSGAKTNFSEDFSIYEQDVNLIFWINTEQIYNTTDYISTEEFEQRVLNALSNARFDAIVSINNVVEGYNDTWSDFDIVNDDTMKFNFKNYVTFKINLTLNVKETICKC
jgi:hypothetical protein